MTKQYPAEQFDVEREQIFDRVAPLWDGMAPRPPMERIKELIAVLEVKDKVVLDVGAGTGILLEAGLAAGPKQWIACDLSKEMLKVLQANFQPKATGQLVTLHADVHALPLAPESVDRVICYNVFPHFHNPETALVELFRVLRPGGIMIINHFAGREIINQIHKNARDTVLHRDMLVPAETASRWITGTGFKVTATVDSEEMYRIIAVRPEAVSEVERT